MCCTHQHRTAAHANTLHKLIFLVINMLISLQGPWWQSDSWGGSSSSKFSQRHHRDRRCPRAYQESFQRQGCLHSTLLSIILVKRIWHILCSAISLSLFFYALQRGISLWKTLWSWHHKQRKTMNMKKCHDDVNSRHILGCQNSAVNSFSRELTQWAQGSFIGRSKLQKAGRSLFVPTGWCWESCPVA